jgi:predicted MPP superfamily phosphohydrolase
MNRTFLIGTGLLAAGIVTAGLPYHMDVSDDSIASKKIKAPIRIAVISDLHCRRFGRGQSRILNIIKKEKPDLVIIPGDLFDVDRDFEISFELIRGLRGLPVYFTSGNHDIYLKEQIGRLRLRLEAEGVHVLEDSGTLFAKDGCQIEIYGMKDQGSHVKFPSREISEKYHTDAFRILISHRPDYIDFYRSVDCDLIISGHAHGGQWRIPFTHQGVYFPHQGLFPKYTEGVHDLNGRKLVISRGLASGCPWIPRLYNNPEIVIIDLKQA